ncbi:TonB-dependent receptor domain-containing protein [Pelagicoccus mobilis]|uniref:TonB-dependent receptor n=1 Tax=Pelagicoccus mobilis TaxID=415221 RepID=A0A934VJN6_9BACT|nr:TonB-dependent receptor [Pelagicoccus mobilis]MBK1875811.1 TonB-dependent receptor [Pelagicoccus mobilis]
MQRSGFGKSSTLAALLAVAIATCAHARVDVQSVTKSDAIVSEKASVELVSDSSVGEAIGRRPDLSFSNVTIDGQGSQISLDSISADAITSVEVMKAVTPDQDADSRGGSISLKSKPAYLQKSTKTKLSLETEYDSGSGNFGYEGSISMSGAFNEVRTLGGRISARWEENSSGFESTSQDWTSKTVNGEKHFVLREKTLFQRRDNSTEKELGAGIDFKASEDLSFTMRGNFMMDSSAMNLPHYKYRFAKGTFLSADEKRADIKDAQVESGIFASGWDTEELEMALGADWNHGDWEVDAKFIVQEDSFEQTAYNSMDFVAYGVDMQYDLAEDPRFPKISTTGVDLDDPSAYEFEDMIERSRFEDKSDTITSLNVKLNNVLGNHKAFVRFGMKSRLRDRVRDNEYAYNDSGFAPGDFTLSELPVYQTEVLDGRYQIAPYAERGAFLDHLEGKRDSLIYDERRSREASDYSSNTVEEQVDALYGMASLEIGKWRGLFGVRQEETSISFTSNEVLLGKDLNDKDSDGDLDEIVYLDTKPTFGDNRYVNYFPNSQMRYKWNDWATLIASYTNTIDRPSYGEVVPYRRVDVEDKEISEGNPDLKPTLYRNLDMSLDMNVGPGAMVSVELFDRAVEDVIFAHQSIVSGGVYDGYELERQENNASAQIRGLSVSWNQPVNLVLLPEGFSLNAKYTQQETELVYPFRPDEVLPKTNSPDSRMRLALNYETRKVFAQLKFAHSDTVIYKVDSNPAKDRYRVPSDSMDLMVSYKVQDKTRLYFEWENKMGGSSYETYEGVPFRSTRYQEAPWSLATGVKMEL